MTASVTTVLTLDGREVSHFYDGQVDNLRWSPVEDVFAINHGVELHIVDSGGQTTKRIHPPFEIEAVHGIHGGDGDLEWFSWFFDQGLMPLDEARRQIELFAEHIIPAFR